MKNYLNLLPTSALALLLSFALADGVRAQAHEHGGNGHKEKTERSEMHEGMSHEGMMHEGMHAKTKEGKVLHPKMIDGVQVVEITVTPAGYSAKQIALEAGVPTRLVFTRTVDGGCMHQVQIPHFGVEATDLPLDEAVAIEFTPDEGGTFSFACGMDMMMGTLLVRS